MTLDALYWLAAILGLVGGFSGNRVAWPLLASFAFYEAAVWQGWAFDKSLWMTVDCVVLLGIATVFAWGTVTGAWKPGLGDVAVIALFVPLLLSYGLEQATAHVLSLSVCIAQLLSVFPARAVWRRFRSMPRERDRWNEFDLMVST